VKSKLLHAQNGLRTFAVVFDKGDEVKEQILEFAKASRFADAHITAIGAFSEVSLGFFDRHEKTYKPIQIEEQVEVLSFSGNIVQGWQANAACACGCQQMRRSGIRRPFHERKSLADTGNDRIRNAGLSTPHTR
jgi:hypothetical protein